MIVTITSFSHKRGLPEDKTGNGGGFAFDCRAMPNPYWDESLRGCTGRDKPICDFFDRYKDDATAMEIYRAILTEYQEEFSDEDSGPLLYTVCYALAQCLWECGERDEWLWQKIREIIDTEADLNFWDELGMEPELKKSRQRALDKFWDKINSVPAKLRKPKKTGKKREPTLHKGDLYAYAV